MKIKLKKLKLMSKKLFDLDPIHHKLFIHHALRFTSCDDVEWIPWWNGGAEKTFSFTFQHTIFYFFSHCFSRSIVRILCLFLLSSSSYFRWLNTTRERNDDGPWKKTSRNSKCKKMQKCLTCPVAFSVWMPGH